MQKVIALILGLAAMGWSAIGALTIPHEIDSAAIPKVIYIDQNNDSIINRVNEIKDTVNGLSAGTAAFSGLTASRLMSTNASKQPASVTDLTSWIAGTANQITSTSDGDGTLTLSLPSAVTLPGTLSGTKISASDSLVGAHLKTVSGNLIVGGTGAITGALSSGAFSATTGAFSSTLAVTSTATFGAAVVLNNASVTNRTIGWQTAGSDRWGLTVGSTAEGGSNAGSNLLLRAFTDAGAVIDTPFTITRAASGTYAIRRPVTVSEKLTGSDTIAAALGFRAGSAGATDVQLYRSGANMWTTPDSLTVAGRVAVSGTLTADTLISRRFYGDTSFTVTGTGFSTPPTGTAYATWIGRTVVMYVPALSGTSNASTFTITGIPAKLRPARLQVVYGGDVNEGGATSYQGSLDVGTDGVLTVYRRTAVDVSGGGGYATSGGKGMTAVTITYSLL